MAGPMSSVCIWEPKHWPCLLAWSISECCCSKRRILCTSLVHKRKKYTVVWLQTAWFIYCESISRIFSDGWKFKATGRTHGPIPICLPKMAASPHQLRFPTGHPKRIHSWPGAKVWWSAWKLSFQDENYVFFVGETCWNHQSNERNEFKWVIIPSLETPHGGRVSEMPRSGFQDKFWPAKPSNLNLTRESSLAMPYQTETWVTSTLTWRFGATGAAVNIC